MATLMHTPAYPSKRRNHGILWLQVLTRGMPGLLVRTSSFVQNILASHPTFVGSDIFDMIVVVMQFVMKNDTGSVDFRAGQ